MWRKSKVGGEQKKYQSTGSHKRIVLLPVLLLPLFILAQEVDSVYSDENEEEIEAPQVTKKASHYFVEKWLSESAPDPVQLRQLPDTSIQNLKKDKAFWYADSVFRTKTSKKELQKEKTQPVPPSTSQKTQSSARQQRDYSGNTWVEPFLWIVILGGFLAFVLLYLSNSNANIFRRKNRKFDEESAELETDDIFAINYQREIDKAAANGNHRLAIRLMFLRLLKNLAEADIIRYKQDRTNFDYLVQLRETRYYDDFFRITRNYEYAWYGKFPITENAYQVIKKDFENFYPNLKK